jgi:ribosome-binding factor A
MQVMKQDSKIILPGIRAFCLLLKEEISIMEQYSTRQNKISRLIQREMADILLKMNKSRFTGKLISVTVVRVTKDLGIARIYLSIFPSEFSSEIIEDIRLSNKQLRGELGRKVGKSLRVIPELEFYIDDSLDYIDNIDKLLDS